MTALLAVLASPPPAGGDTGGTARSPAAVAQAGAVTARAAEASVVLSNPAAIAGLDGLELLATAGLDLPDSTYALAWRAMALKRQAAARPALVAVAWHSRRWPWLGLGLGVERSVLYREDRMRTSFPTSEIETGFEVTAWQLRPAVAIALSRGWSIGAGLRYMNGRVRDRYAMTLDVGRNPGTFFVTGLLSASAPVEGWRGDISLWFRGATWGAGLTATSGATLEGRADFDLTIRGDTSRALHVADSVAYLLEQAPRVIGFDLPPELRAGVWFSPLHVLRVETDVALTRWSAAGWRRPREVPLCGASCRQWLPIDWRDTTAVRAGLEVDITRRFQVRGGMAVEPSPSRDRQAHRSGALANFFPQGLPPPKARVYGVGGSWNAAVFSVDVGYHVRAHEPVERFGDVYRIRTHVLALAMRWRWR
ncbi:MAG TPA: outer membrane protein transport protein [Vicinamibacterales bacterium]|nr:outer membrane protein transport protein [Vicinamibacterales bacterium]